MSKQLNYEALAIWIEDLKKKAKYKPQPQEQRFYQNGVQTQIKTRRDQ